MPAEMTALSIGKDSGGNVDYTAEPSTITYKTTLAAGVEQTLVVPEGAKKAFFSFSQENVVIKKGTTAAAFPGGSFTLVEKEDLRPSGWPVEEGETLRFISDDACIVYVKFYKNRVF